MREILFRGKTQKHEPFNEGNNDKWVEGHFCKDSFVEKTYINENVGADNFFMYMVIPETVGEYTGLKDRNGVKIFEGDVVEHPSIWAHPVDEGTEGAYKNWRGRWYLQNENENGAVVFSEGRFRVSGCEHLDTTVFEVVGNIHDNPELVKRRKA
jgi:uncharacterized phage protein (TIGR01671 family)